MNLQFVMTNISRVQDRGPYEARRIKYTATIMRERTKLGVRSELTISNHVRV